jgi:hypothetical protein
MILPFIISFLFIGICVVAYFISKKENFTYSKNKDKSKLVEYLNSVYPLTNWDKIPAKKVVKFYDMLGFVYNPCSQYLKDDLSGINNSCYDSNSSTYGKQVCGTVWKPLEICKSFYPYRPPKGWLLSFKDYHERNQHSVYSDGCGDMKDMTSYRQTLHWGVSSSGGEVSRTCRSGPGPYWLTTFSIVRDYYYPNGIKFEDGSWTIKCNMSPKLKNHGCDWNHPKNWTNGFKEGDYIEVAHSQNNPGMAQSVGFWFNGLPGGGTGIFLKIGKTHIANNKIDTLYTLFEKLKNSSAKDLYGSMSNTKFVGKSGSEILKFYYKTDDVDDITWGYVNGEWGSMSYTSGGKPLVNPSDNMWKWIGNKGVLSASGLMTKDKIAVSGFDGEGYKPNLTVNFAMVAYWWLEQKGFTGGLTKENKRYILNAARNPEEDIDYFPNRAGGMVPPDEPICWLSFVLGIETIQMPMSANDNGLWVYEIIDLRFPTPQNTPGLPSKYSDWSDLCKERVYGWITDGYDDSKPESGSGENPGSNFGPVWNVDGQRWWMVHVQKFLSSRDPFNIKNGKNCKEIGYINGLTKFNCNNPFPNVPDVEGISSKGYFDKEKRCWVAIDGGGWQNIPCISGTMQQHYIKIPLMYP